MTTVFDLPARETGKHWVASAAGHLLLLTALLLIPPLTRKLERHARQESISVELVPPGDEQNRMPSGPATSQPANPQEANSLATAPDPATAGPPPSGPTAPAKIQDGSGWTTARTLLAQSLLDAPQSRQARASLATLSQVDRQEQLCGLEAMKQLRSSPDRFLPERLVAYAVEEPVWSGRVMTAKGAAFRSRSQWYHVAFRCEVSPGGGSITAFAFKAGAPIARQRWEELNLPAIH